MPKSTPFTCVALIALLAAGNLAAAPAAELFGEHCVACHGTDGKARTPAARKLGVKDLSQSRLDDGAVAKQIAEGSRNERGVERMPGFKEKLSPAEIDSLVAYVKSFRK